MRGRSSGKTGPPVPGLTRVGGGGLPSSLQREGLEQFADDELEYEGIQAGVSCPALLLLPP